MNAINGISGKQTRGLLRSLALGTVLASLAGCVLEPYPEQPYPAPPPGVAVAPGPYYGAAAPCCYYYPEYPPYYGYPGPTVGVGLGFYGGGYRGGWRGR